MGNGCLLPSTTINSTRIGTVFVIHPNSSGGVLPPPPPIFIEKTFQNPVPTANGKQRRRRRILNKQWLRPSTVDSLPSTSFDSPNLLTPKDKELIERCWRERIMVDRKDIFHRTMLFCIEASPKMNEIIACGRYCYRDLTKWPKLNRICQAQFNFFERLIYEFKLDEAKMHEACWWLGEMHANYAKFGLKSHFLDIYQQQFLSVLAKVDMRDKAETCIAFTHLTSFVIDVMNRAYSQKSSDIRLLGGTTTTMTRYI